MRCLPRLVRRRAGGRVVYLRPRLLLAGQEGGLGASPGYREVSAGPRLRLAVFQQPLPAELSRPEVCEQMGEGLDDYHATEPGSPP